MGDKGVESNTAAIEASLTSGRHRSERRVRTMGDPDEATPTRNAVDMEWVTQLGVTKPKPPSGTPANNRPKESMFRKVRVLVFRYG
jgi:hypothetical protein